MSLILTSWLHQITFYITFTCINLADAFIKVILRVVTLKTIWNQHESKDYTPRNCHVF